MYNLDTLNKINTKEFSSVKNKKIDLSLFGVLKKRNKTAVAIAKDLREKNWIKD